MTFNSAIIQQIATNVQDSIVLLAETLCLLQLCERVVSLARSVRS